VDDWKIGSLDSQGSGPLLERADGEENHRRQDASRILIAMRMNGKFVLWSQESV
jgi:hypothetical protein